MIFTTLSIPAESADICNTIGHVIDSDIGGARTFEPNASVDGSLPFTHCRVDVLLTEATRNLLNTRNGAAWLAALEVYSLERGRTAPTLQACQHMVSVVKIDDEVDVVYANLNRVG